MSSISQSRDGQPAANKNNNNKNKKQGQHGGRQRAKNLHPLQAGILDFIKSHTPRSQLTELHLKIETLASALPKRYTVYTPLLLLPANAFSTPPAWAALYATLTEFQREMLYACIAKAFARMGVTHIAINAPIALIDISGHENRLRSPVGLVPLYGDFGSQSPVPKANSDQDREEKEKKSEEKNAQPSPADLNGAFWVSTAQNHGIVQIWAPLYTMFSRGNITEKARILRQGSSAQAFEGLDRQSLHDQAVAEISVVDLYAGIGYFVFSYLRSGVKRVWGWELNGWSVEGLRRGCVANGWGCKVVKLNKMGELSGDLVEDLVASLSHTDRVVVFHGDNRCAAEILVSVRDIMEKSGTWDPVRHVNLGLLPSSQPSWQNACRVIDLRRGGWLHVHENADIHAIEQKKLDIVEKIANLRALVPDNPALFEAPVAHCRHVEQVKTYAPGVMHCVFDVRLSAVRDPEG